MDDEHDIFISYRRDPPFGPWVRDLLFPELLEAMRREMPVEPDIFRDEQSIEPGEVWPEKLHRALSRSRLMIAVLCPPYFFQSRWCPAEWRTMEQREKAVEEDPTILPLLIPIRYSDGDCFPKTAQERQAADFTPFNVLEAQHKDTRLWLDFKGEVGKLARTLTRRLLHIPPWSPDWPKGRMERWNLPKNWRTRL